MYAIRSYYVDSTNAPIADAEVTGNFTGPTSESVSGTTNSSGIVEFTSRSVRGATGTWCLEITDVSKNGYEFTGPVSACENTLKSASIIATPEPGINVYPNPFTDKRNNFV